MTSPDIPVSAMRFKGGEVVELKLRDGTAISEPICPLGTIINLQEIIPLGIELLKIYDRRLECVFYCPHTRGVCSIWCAGEPGPAFVAGDFWIHLDPTGAIEKVELPDGNIISQPFRNLREQPSLNIELRGHYPITLLGIRAESGEVMLRVLP